METYKQSLGKVSITVEKDDWDINKEYDRLVIVKPSNTYKSYISRKPVPAGIQLTDTNYWKPFSALDEQLIIDFNRFLNSIYTKEQVNGFLLQKADKNGNSNEDFYVKKLYANDFDIEYLNVQNVVTEKLKNPSSDYSIEIPVVYNSGESFITRSDLLSYIATGVYNSNTKRINFYNDNQEILFYIDATDFIKDGMVSSVSVINNNLVITFNTDSGKQDIIIPLSSIFDSDKLEENDEVLGIALNQLQEILVTALLKNTDVIGASLSKLKETLDGKQEKLVSGTNVKTINGQSILGSGNINSDKLYFIDINTDTYDDLIEKFNNGYVLLHKYNDDILVANGIHNGLIHYIRFIGLNTEMLNIFAYDSFSRFNEVDRIYYEKQSNKSTSITENSTNKQYASAKAVYDFANMENITYSVLKTKRNNGKLIPGRYYRITDYVTTVDTYMNPNAQSANHQFDIIVRADSINSLNEEAWAIQHSGDSYFNNNNLSKWKVRYNLDNIKWSQKAGVHCNTSGNNYNFRQIGTVDIEGTSYILWEGDKNVRENESSEYCVSIDYEQGAILYSYNPENPTEIVDIDSIDDVTNIETEGKGTIVKLIDEFNNECFYDFKNIMFKRWKATDSSTDSEYIDGNYLVAQLNQLYPNITVEDDTDFIWAYTFSSDDSGGEQEDYSLNEKNNVYNNVIKESYILNNNVLFGSGNYNNVFEYYNENNTFSKNCYDNKLEFDCSCNIFKQNCYKNSFGCNSSLNILEYSSNNVLGNDCIKNTLNIHCDYNIFEANCSGNSLGIYSNYNHYMFNIHNTAAASDTKNIQVLSSTSGGGATLSLPVTANASYTQFVGFNSSGTLKVWTPADLVQ